MEHEIPEREREREKTGVKPSERLLKGLGSQTKEKISFPSVQETLKINH